MFNSVRILLLVVRAAAVTSAAWGIQVQAEDSAIGSPRQPIIDDAQASRRPQEVIKPEPLDAASRQTRRSNGRILFAQDGQLVGPPRYASREKMGSAEIVTFVTTPPAQENVGSGNLPTGLPVAGRLSSSFGYRVHPILGGMRWHNGIDIAAPSGTPVEATSDGRVERADWDGGYGLTVKLDDGGGTETLYGHMSRLAVTEGQTVKKGEVLGYVGSTGLSTGPHVHYEIRKSGRAINPKATQSSRRGSTEKVVVLP